jgi:tetratricopeptide (TPR) repeat protein
MGFLDRFRSKRIPSYAELEKQANALERERDYLGAARVWRRVVECHPNSVGGHNNLAKNLYLAGQRDEALEWFDKAVTIAPKNSEVQRNYGVCLMGCGKYEDAEARFIAAYNIDPDNWIAYVNMAEVNEKLGKRDEVIRFYRYVYDHALGKHSAAWGLATERLRAMGEPL